MTLLARTGILCGLILLLGSSAPAAALDLRQPSPALDDHTLVDVDFNFQGEYVGQLFTGEGLTGWEEMGLQVVALGNCSFSAVLYRGGLPGRGWNGAEKAQMNGTRYDDILELDGLATQAVIQHEHAIIWMNRQQLGGFMQRVLRVSRTLGMSPPTGARVLFDGTDNGELVNANITYDKLLMEGAETRESFGDFTMHLEFRLPYMPAAREQGRGNSGVYIQSRYEVQILDSFGLAGAANECGALYKQRPPDVNMCLPPLSWQTYDISFTAAKFLVDGSKLSNARITVLHNGVVIHNDVEIADKTGAGQPEASLPLPTRFQDHGDPVRFRNIWLLANDRGLAQLVPRPRVDPRFPWNGPSRSTIAWPGQPGAIGWVAPGPLHMYGDGVRVGSTFPILHHGFPK